MLAALLSVALTAAGANDASTLLAAELARLRSRGTLTVAGDQICADRMVVTFYARRANQPAWSITTTAALLRAIRSADADGLDPRVYHADAIESLTATDPQTIAARDLLSTDAFLLLGLHLTQGRVNPVTLIREWCVIPRRVDLAAALQSALDAENIEAMLQSLAPHHRQYSQLRVALARYRQVARAGGWPLLTAGPPLRLGDRGARVVELRRRLAAEPMSAPLDLQTDLFDAALDQAVRTFQEHHGLIADGVAGGATRRELNVSAADRARQIELNMERWRWMPDQLGDSYVLVNIAAFRLDVVEGGRSILNMKTVVGKSFWETPFFLAKITEVVINPSWFVPEKIADEELWPKQKRDRSYFAGEHIEILPGGALRQLPGPWNSLGRIKFNMPNPFLVYLHDSPATALFALQTRAFSHGCIRLEKAADLALLLLRDQPDWNPTSLQAAIDSETERVVRLTKPEPVYVLYWTAWPGRDGRTSFHDDVYKRDAQLGRALRSTVTPLRSANH